jgi:hypothetical protein
VHHDALEREVVSVDGFWAKILRREVAATGRREEEMTEDKSQIANGASDGPAEIAEK